MPSIGNIVLNDGKTTPVAHTFVPQSGQTGTNGSISYEKTAGIFVGFEKLQTTVRRSESGKATRVMLQLAVPTLAVTAPATGTGIQPQPTVAYTVLAKIEFVLPDSCSTQDREDIRVLAKNLLDNSLIADAVDNMAPLY